MMTDQRIGGFLNDSGSGPSQTQMKDEIGSQNLWKMGSGIRNLIESNNRSRMLLDRILSSFKISRDSLESLKRSDSGGDSSTTTKDDKLLTSEKLTGRNETTSGSRTNVSGPDRPLPLNQSSTSSTSSSTKNNLESNLSIKNRLSSSPGPSSSAPTFRPINPKVSPETFGSTSRPPSSTKRKPSISPTEQPPYEKDSKRLRYEPDQPAEKSPEDLKGWFPQAIQPEPDTKPSKGLRSGPLFRKSPPKENRAEADQKPIPTCPAADRDRDSDLLDQPLSAPPERTSSNHEAPGQPLSAASETAYSSRDPRLALLGRDRGRKGSGSSSIDNRKLTNRTSLAAEPIGLPPQPQTVDEQLGEPRTEAANEYALLPSLDLSLMRAIKAHGINWSFQKVIESFIRLGFLRERQGRWRKNDWEPIPVEELVKLINEGDPLRMGHIIKSCHCYGLDEFLQHACSRHVLYIITGPGGRREVKLGKDYTPLGLTYNLITKSLRKLSHDEGIKKASTHVLSDHLWRRIEETGVTPAEVLLGADNFQKYVEAAEADGVVQVEVLRRSPSTNGFRQRMRSKRRYNTKERDEGGYDDYDDDDDGGGGGGDYDDDGETVTLIQLNPFWYKPTFTMSIPNKVTLHMNLPKKPVQAERVWRPDGNSGVEDPEIVGKFQRTGSGYFQQQDEEVDEVDDDGVEEEEDEEEDEIRRFEDMIRTSYTKKCYNCNGIGHLTLHCKEQVCKYCGSEGVHGSKKFCRLAARDRKLSIKLGIKLF